MSWSHILKLALSIFTVQLLIGFFEGFLGSDGASITWTFGSNFVSFAVCGAIFALFASRQSVQPFKHAWTSLFIDQAAGLLFAALVGSWLGTKPSLLLSTIGLIALICALLVGTSIGIRSRCSIFTRPDA